MCSMLAPTDSHVEVAMEGFVSNILVVKLPFDTPSQKL